MENGFIYPIFAKFITHLCKLNLVEYFKDTASWLVRDKNDKAKIASWRRIATDIFIGLKWLFISGIWAFRIESPLITLLVWYLLFANLFTYFYYHVWFDDSTNAVQRSVDGARRRFLLFMTSFAFSNVCFAYFYSVPYQRYMSWDSEDFGCSRMKSLWFSMSNSIAANYDVIKPDKNVANNVAMLQLVVTFFFLSIILSKSVPDTK